MVEIKNILGERLMSVPILRDAVIHKELMASDYIALSWNADEGEELPVGAYIEYEGERYTLYEPYLPTMVNEGEYRYNPKFYSREEAWNKQPACVYTYGDDGKTIKSRDFDWSLVGSPEDAMHIIKQAIKNETGEEWTIAIADSLPATIDVSSQASSIVSVLSDIASQCSTEYWLDKKNNVIHLSKCEVGDPVSLEVGSNVGIPSVTSNKSEYFTRYYALGSTRNITQSGGSVNGTVNKRLTLDPAVYPMGYKDVKGRIENGVFVSELEQGEIFSKVLIFDDIYPSSSLEITDVRPRMKYLLDGGKKVKVGGTDEEPVYDQYAIWYFKIKDFVFSEDLLIKGLPLSVHFKSGRLAGQEFELIYHSKAVTENTEGDVIPFDVQAGDFEIKFTESTGTIIPDIAYIIPQESDKIILFNIEMPAEYTTSAQQELLEALDKAIEEDRKDGNTYEVESNPIAFYEMGLLIDLGQRVSFKYGGHSLETRALMVERRLDNTCEQKIRVGNDIIQGSTKELRENVATLNHNVDVLSAFNDLSRSIQDGYGRTQALINESVALVLGIWTLDSEGNLVTEKKVRINNNLIVEGDMASQGEGNPSLVGASGVIVGATEYRDLDGDGLIDLTSLMALYTPLSSHNSLASRVSTLEDKSTSVLVSQTLTSGKEIGAITIDGVAKSLYAPSTYNWSEITNQPSITVAYGYSASNYEELTWSGRDLLLTPYRYVINDYMTGSPCMTWSMHKLESEFAKYLPLSGGTIDGSLQVVSQNGEINLYNKNNGNTGWLFYNGGSEWKVTDNGWQHDYALIHTGNIGSQSVASATRLVTSSGAYMIHLTDYTLYIGDSVYPTRSTNLFGKEIALRYGASAANGLILNSSGNVTIGSQDLAGVDYKLFVESGIASQYFLQLTPKENVYSTIEALETGMVLNSVHNNVRVLPIMLATNGGNVLIGTTTDNGAKLQVDGNIRLGAGKDCSIGSPYETSDSTAYNNITFGSHSTGLKYYSGSWTGSNVVAHEFIVNAGSALAIMNNGNVGIGTYNPLAKLHVAGDAIITGDLATGSDIRFKDIISNTSIDIKDIANAPLFTFKWNDREDSNTHLGTSAQYWEDKYDGLVTGEEFKTLNYASLGVAMGISLARKAMNHEERIKVLEEENKALKQEIKRMQYGS